jgi:hypothetical protein
MIWFTADYLSFLDDPSTVRFVGLRMGNDISFAVYLLV